MENLEGFFENFEGFFENVIELSQDWLLKLIYAILILIVGLIIIKRLTKLLRKSLQKRNMEPYLVSFFMKFGNILLKIVLVITIIEILGVELTSLTVIIGAGGLAVGMALSGTLQNFAGSVMIHIFKPFKVDDYIEAQGYSGIVKEIQIFNTILITLDNKRVIIPNGGLATNCIVNYSAEPIRRIDLEIGISYKDDIDKARAIALKILAKNSKILKEPDSFVGVLELGDSSVNLAIRPWVKSEDYWEVFFGAREDIKKAFDREGVTIPFPQRDVHLIPQESVQ